MIFLVNHMYTLKGKARHTVTNKAQFTFGPYGSFRKAMRSLVKLSCTKLVRSITEKITHRKKIETLVL